MKRKKEKSGPHSSARHPLRDRPARYPRDTKKTIDKTVPPKGSTRFLQF